MGHLINHANLGEVQKTVYLTAIVVSTDSEFDTMEFTGIGDCPSATAVPVFYHCADDVERRSNGALEGGSAAFAADDEVVVQCSALADGVYAPLFVIGFVDKPKHCCLVLEDFDEYDTEYWQEFTGEHGSVTHIESAMWLESLLNEPGSWSYIVHEFEDQFHPPIPAPAFTLAIEMKVLDFFGGMAIAWLSYPPIEIIFYCTASGVSLHLDGALWGRSGDYKNKLVTWTFAFNGETLDVYEDNLLVGTGLVSRECVYPLDLHLHANAMSVIYYNVSLCGGARPPKGVEP